MTELKKRCPNCNRMFGPRVTPSGKTEYPSAFKKKLFCSQTCNGIWRESQKNIARAAAETVSQQENGNG